MVLASLLAVIAILFYICRSRHDYTLGVGLLIVASTWLALEVHLLRIVSDLFALAVEHWVGAAMACSAAVLLIVPAMMLYAAIHDQAHRSNLARAHPHRPIRNTVLHKFERRVATLMALGYDRTEAEVTALQQMKRDLAHGQNADLAASRRAR